MHELIPIVGMVMTLGPLAVLVISFTPLGRALSARLRAGSRLDHEERLNAMKEELRRELMEEQSAQLEELYERLDFTERLLSDVRLTTSDQKRIVTPV